MIYLFLGQERIRDVLLLFFSFPSFFLFILLFICFFNFLIVLFGNWNC